MSDKAYPSPLWRTALPLAAAALAAPAVSQTPPSDISISNQTAETQSCRFRGAHSGWSAYHPVAARFAITIPASGDQLYYIECQPPAKPGVYEARSGDRYVLRAQGRGPAVIQKAPPGPS